MESPGEASAEEKGRMQTTSAAAAKREGRQRGQAVRFVRFVRCGFPEREWEREEERSFQGIGKEIKW
jgi:hypothetical protein